MSKTLFTNLNLFDGVHNKISRNLWMLVNNNTGKIEDFGSDNEPFADKTVNLHGKYIMPGIVNVHTHVSIDPRTPDGDGNADIVTSTVRAVKHLHQLLKSGVTYVRGCGCNHEMLDIALNKLQREGRLTKVPRMVPCGKPMTMTGGHGILFGGGGEVDSPDEMRKAVRTNFANGAKCTKVMATGGVMSVNDNMTQPQLKVPEMKVAVEETHSKGFVVAAHAEANPGIMNAIKAGVDSIEHCFYLTSQEIQMMLNKKIYLTPTLIALWTIIVHGNELPKWELNKALDCMHHGFDSIHRAYKAGIPLTFGTDSGCPYDGFTNSAIEFQLMVDKIGMTNFDALETSRNSAKLLKLKDYGTLQKGKYADFLVLNHDPLQNVKAVQQADKAVYQHGKREY